jgi:hypothetical protein
MIVLMLVGLVWQLYFNSGIGHAFQGWLQQTGNTTNTFLRRTKHHTSTGSIFKMIKDGRLVRKLQRSRISSAGV